MKISQLRNSFPKVQIITHTDLDGYGSGAVITKFLTEIGYNIDDIMITHTNYDNAFPVLENYNLIFLTDISLSNTNDAEKVLDFSRKTNKFLFWFDHHQTSLEMSNQFPYLEEIPGIRDTNASATMLCFIFYQLATYYHINDFENNLPVLINELKFLNVREIMDSYNPGIITWPKSTYKKVPFGILFTDDYDRFILKYKFSKFFNAAFYQYPDFERNCKSAYFQNEYMSEYDQYLEEYVRNGKNCMLWQRLINLNTLKSNGFIASFKVDTYKNIEMLCINSSFKSSDVFGNCYGDGTDPKLMQFNHVCVYTDKCRPLVGKGRVTVSIYCANPQKASEKNLPNAAEICKRMGGGGHPGAAGFIMNHLPKFSNVKKLPKRLILQIDEEIKEIYKSINKEVI